MKESVIEAIASEYIATLEFPDVHNPSIHISFSAVPGSGKTTLARRLSKDLKAHYIRSDEVRRMLGARGEEINSDIVRTITGRIIQHIFKEDTNQLIVIDASIDRSWSTFYDFAASCEAMTFIIRLNVPDEIIERRLIKRDGSADREKMRRFRDDLVAGREKIPANIELGAEYNYEEVLDQIKTMLGLAAK